MFRRTRTACARPRADAAPGLSRPRVVPGALP